MRFEKASVEESGVGCQTARDSGSLMGKDDCHGESGSKGNDNKERKKDGKLMNSGSSIIWDRCRDERRKCHAGRWLAEGSVDGLKKVWGKYGRRQERLNIYSKKSVINTSPTSRTMLDVEVLDARIGLRIPIIDPHGRGWAPNDLQDKN